MQKTRLEAFSDGMFSIFITIMVLEMKIPHGDHFQDLLGLWPVFISYILSFLFVGIYWNNHHHLFHTVHHVSAKVMWANMYLLFWLSLIPFTTGWMGENHFDATPTALYGLVLLMAAFAYSLLSSSIIKSHGKNSLLAVAIGKDYKGRLSLLLYVVAIPSALFIPFLAWGLYGLVALIWFIPDRRIEKVLVEEHEVTSS